MGTGTPVNTGEKITAAKMNLKLETIDPANIFLNVVRGIVPSVLGWDTDPTNLANITDGNFTTKTGIGSKIQSAGWEGAYIYWDLATRKNCLIGIDCEMATSAGSVYVFAADSPDGTTWTWGADMLTVISIGSLSRKPAYSHWVSQQFVGFVFTAGVTATIQVRIAEAWVIELPL